MSTNVTKVSVNSPFTFYEQVLTAATSTTDGGSEEFVVTLAKADEGSLLIVSNPTSTNGSDVTVEFLAGDFWYSEKQSAKTSTVAAGKTGVFAIESGFVKKGDGKVKINLTPVTASCDLATLGVKVGFIEKA